MDQRQPGGSRTPPADHIYVDGYGFVTQDPWIQENRELWKSAAITGSFLLIILVVPYLIRYPVQAVLNLMFGPLLYASQGTYVSAELKIIYQELGSLLLYSASMVIPVVIAAVTLRPKRRHQSMFRKPSAHMLFSGAAIGAGVAVLFYLGSHFISLGLQKVHLLSLTPDASVPTVPLAAFFYVIRMLVLPALLEEVLFRGFLLRSLRQFGDSFAIIISSVAFGLIHFTITRDIRNFALGLVLAYFVIRSGSLWTAIVTRFTCLSLALLVDFLPQMFPGEQAALVQCLFLSVILAVGICSFILFCYTESNPFALSSGHTSTTISRKIRKFFTNIIFLAAVVPWILQAVSYLQYIG